MLLGLDILTDWNTSMFLNSKLRLDKLKNLGKLPAVKEKMIRLRHPSKKSNDPDVGLIITIHGRVASGKTTLAQALANFLSKRGFDIELNDIDIFNDKLLHSKAEIKKS